MTQTTTPAPGTLDGHVHALVKVYGFDAVEAALGRAAPTQAPDLTAVAETETGEYDGRPTYTVWITYPHANVDRPRTLGIGCTKANLPRLTAAVNAQAAVPNPVVLTDVAGRTYVGGTCQIHTRYINVDLKRLGF